MKTILLNLAFLAALLGEAAVAQAPPSGVRAPYIETFSRDSKTVVYVATTHHSPLLFPDAMADPAFKTINSILSTSPPNAVIVEGVDPSLLRGFLEFAKQCAAANYNLPGRQCGEAEFAAYSAIKSGAQVYTGEPSAAVELSSFEAQGYSVQDFLAFWIMNNIPPEKRQRQFTEEVFRRLVDRVVGNINHELGTSVRFSPEDFSAWYANKMSSPRNYLEIANEDTNPYPSPDEPKTLLHTLSAVCNKARDENVVATIKSVVSNHARVLVVYGASHLDFEWQDLLSALGVPKYSKPF